MEQSVADLIEALPDPVLIVDGEDRIQALNVSARALLGRVRVGDALTLALRVPDVLDAVGRVRAGGGAEAVSWRERVPLDRMFDVRLAALEQPGEPSVVIVFRDLTEMVRVERMRVDFVANASHELRTPLASLLGFIETLQGAARDDGAARGRFLGIMADQARRMARLVDDLLSLSRIEQHLHVRPRDTVDLAGVLGHVVDTLRPVAAETGATIRLQAAGPVMVRGDRDELVRLGENLVGNALKYGVPPNGDAAQVDVAVTSAGGDGVLSVEDHGPGIPAIHLPRLTERFYRVEPGTSRSAGGTGLGLAIVKHIVARHRGRLAIESPPGRGATFTVRLPLANNEG